ncbi:electron transfer flavoprotein subunit beta/FixA family protein [Thioalkalivibrio sp. ALJ7]|uniref:electron transfer flavoprotein subunit beta/FixA family protein n=1 Tax=Thioalkalivibrio sp. ALJ7 TaxID=1158756 RepID=UPI000382BAB4|nr:electron transfer flavoprotein subunit beta/FixA family protein [Thioalkalivibrio sp. ALJ7]
MKVLVGVKRVIDYNVNIRVKSDGSGVETENVRMSANPFDEIALEEAVRLKEAGICSELLAVTVGDEASQEVLRSALAMGADRAIRIDVTESPQPLNVAALLAAVAREEAVDLVLLGKQAIDDDANQAGQMTAALLGWPQGTFASELTIAEGRARVAREIDGGQQTVELDLPAVVTADLRLNEPRFVKLPAMMKAKKRPIEERTPEALGVDMRPRVERVKVSEPVPREAGVKVADVDELLDKLRNEAGVI